MGLDRKAHYRLPQSFAVGDTVRFKANLKTAYTVTEVNPVGVWIRAKGKIDQCVPPEVLIKAEDLAFDRMGMFNLGLN